MTLKSIVISTIILKVGGNKAISKILQKIHNQTYVLKKSNLSVVMKHMRIRHLFKTTTLFFIFILSIQNLKDKLIIFIIYILNLKDIC